MKTDSREMAVINNPGMSADAPEEEGDYVNAAVCVVVRDSATPRMLQKEDKKKTPSIIQSLSPVAVCWVILVIIMGLRIHFTKEIANEKQTCSVNISKLGEKILQIMVENQQLREENQQLRDENQQLGAQNKRMMEEIQHFREENYRLTAANPTLTTENQWLTSDPHQTSSFYSRKKRQTGPCQPGWLHFLSSCYVIGSRDSLELKTWEEAQDTCRGKDADLVVIESPEQRDFIYNSSLVGSEASGFWIGLRVEGDSWKWVNGSNLTDNFWLRPPAGNHHCVISVQEVGGWKAVSCNVKKEWICQKVAMTG